MTAAILAQATFTYLRSIGTCDQQAIELAIPTAVRSNDQN